MKTYRNLIMVLLVLAVSLWIVLADQVGFGDFTRDTSTRLGLDLVGGVQVLLEGEPPAGVSATDLNQSMDTARTIVENRVNGLGVSEAVVVRAGDKRIVVELPGVKDPEQARATIKQTALLEFVDMSSASYEEIQLLEQTGTPLVTSLDASQIAATQSTTTTAAATIWPTVMTGQRLKTANASTNPQTGEFVVEFELDSEGAQIFSDFTASHIGSVLAIVLDKKIISSPTIQNAIVEGRGLITGNFNAQTATQLAVQLRYGALPIPLKEVETRTVGPSLGQDSLQKSLRAGLVGFILVILFMILYYRVPGVIAAVSIIIYALITYGLYRFLPVTLTLPGIAGFLLSTGSALDANILIFERMKEELRSGRTLGQALRLGWERAWPSIRDSNFATVITCVILWFFGSTSGATIVKGFSVTLLVGIIVSLFTAVVVTRTFLNLVLGNLKLTNFEKWFGI